MKETKKSLIPYYKKISLRGRETVRNYVFPGGEMVTISHPDFLIISDNGHRLYDMEGVSHYIPYGWIHLYWENKGDRSFFCEAPIKEQEDMLGENDSES